MPAGSSSRRATRPCRAVRLAASCRASIRRSGPTTSAACCARRPCTRPVPPRAAGAITAAQLRAVEDAAIAEAVREVEALGMRSVTDGEFRRAWFHLDFLEQLDGRRRHRQHRLQLGRRIDRPHDAAEAVRRRAAAPRPRHPGRRLPLPRVGRHADTEGVDPVADDGPLPRRSRGHRHRRLPGPRGVLRRPGRLLPGRDRRPLRRRLPLRPARRHQPRLPVRPGRCAPAPSSAATIPTPSPTPTPS